MSTLVALIAALANAALPVKTVVVRPPTVGAPVATLSIPRIHFDGLAHQGVGAAQLALGPGHYPSTALPGQAGTVAFAGHRVTHTHPFLEINLLRRGDVITVKTAWGRFRYRVYREEIVAPGDTAVLRDVGFQQLVLTACHPPHTALKRFVVFARRFA